MKPEQVKVAVSLDNGGVVIMSVVTNDGNRVQVAPGTAYIDSLITQSASHTGGWEGLPVSWRQVTDSEIAALDRYFRGAWVDSGGLTINMPKARLIHLLRIREARRPKFLLLDAEYLRAHEQGDTVLMQQVAAQKQALRDLPTTYAPTLEAAATPAQLKAIWPSELA